MIFTSQFPSRFQPVTDFGHGRDRQTLSQHSDATRDIGVAAQRQHGAALARVGSW